MVAPFAKAASTMILVATIPPLTMGMATTAESQPTMGATANTDTSATTIETMASSSVRHSRSSCRMLMLVPMWNTSPCPAIPAAACSPEMLIISAGKIPDINSPRNSISVTNTDDTRAPVRELAMSPMANSPNTNTIAIH